MRFKWTKDATDRLEGLLRDGLTAEEIAQRLGTTKGSIIGKVGRTPELKAIGFKCTREEASRRAAKASAARRSAGKPPKPKPAPKTFPVAPSKPVKPAPPPVTDISTMADAWMKENGGPRRFERGASNDFLAIKDYLRERGYEVRFDGRGRNHGAKVSAGRGRPRKYTYSELVALVDQYRIADGLEPITPPERAAGRAA